MKQVRSAPLAWLIKLKIPILILILSCFVLLAASFVLETEKQIALISVLIIAVVAITPQFRRKLKERSSILFFIVTGYTIYAGLSTLYGYAPKLALSEYSRILAAYALFGVVFTFTKPATIPQTVSVLSGSITLLSFLHLDAASWGIVAPNIMGVFQTLTGGYQPNEYGQDIFGYSINSSRLNGLFGNSNTMACMCAIGLFLAVYLLIQAKGRKRIWPCMALVINSVTFLLCISLGAIAALGLSVLFIAILLHGAKSRLTFLLITLETLIVAGPLTLLSISHLGAPGPTGYLVWVFCILGSAVLFGLDCLLRPRLINILCNRIRILCIGVAALAAILCGCAVFLFSHPVSVTLNGTETLHKRFFPGTGTCEITLEVEGAANLQILTASQPEILQETSSQLLNIPYEGPVTVDIPDDTIEVQMYLHPLDGGTVTVHSISYVSTEKSAEIAPGYRAIPMDILQRFQSLATNHSAMQRFVFMEDSLKMWKQAPIFGRGLGGFENGVTSVQEFHYETKYAHNHYVQLLTDLGIVGLTLFVAMLIFGFKGIWRLRRQEDALGLTPALLGALLMFAIHGAIELSPSVAEVSIFAFGTFGLIACIAPPISIKQENVGTVAWCTSLGTAALFGVYAVLLMFNAQASTNAATGNAGYEQIAHYAKTDLFEGDDYRLTYVVNGATSDDPAIREQAQEFADELQKGHSNSVGPYLTNFYLQLGQYENAAAASEKYLSYTKSVAANWNTQFQIFFTFLENTLDDPEATEILTQIILDTYEKFLEVNQQQLDDLPLTSTNAAYLTQLLSTEDDLKTRMNTLFFDSSVAPDTNTDGCPDAITVLSGEMQWDGGQYTALTDATLQLNVVPTRPGTYAMELITDDGASIQMSVIDHETEIVDTDTGRSMRWTVAVQEVYQPLDIRITLPQGSSIQQSIVKMIDGAFLK